MKKIISWEINHNIIIEVCDEIWLCYKEQFDEKKYDKDLNILNRLTDKLIKERKGYVKT